MAGLPCVGMMCSGLSMEMSSRWSSRLACPDACMSQKIRTFFERSVSSSFSLFSLLSSVGMILQEKMTSSPSVNGNASFAILDSVALGSP